MPRIGLKRLWTITKRCLPNLLTPHLHKTCATNSRRVVWTVGPLTL